MLPDETPGQVQLADGSPVNITGGIHATVRIHDREIQHRFLVMPNLESDMLIGVDLWARTNIQLSPPRHHHRRTSPVTCVLEQATQQGEKAVLQKFLQKELSKFANVQGPTDLIQHSIHTKAKFPIKQRYRPRNPAMQAIIDQEVDEMLAAGVIEPSHSAWSSPVVIVKKKDGKPRFCIDYRKLNEVSERDAYPLPQVTATLDKLRGAKYLSTLDLKNGYWQVPLAPDSRQFTAFTVPGKGLMQFRVMPFGLHSAPATFQRLLDSIIGPELEPNAFAYLDDIIIISRTFQEHLSHLTEVFRRLREARLRLNNDKCHFCVDQLKYLGHIVNHNGIRTDPEKTKAIDQWPTPTTVKQVRQFLGMASWYRRFINNFATVAAPLTALTRKNARWTWGEAEQKALLELKERLTSAPVLACPDFNRPFTLQTDASTTGLGTVLTQYFPEGERVIAYASRTLNQAERNYSATELECLAVVWGIRRMRGYLEGYQFTVLTDHQSLRWLQKLESPTGRLGRWMFELQQYQFNVQYRKGTLNRVADALSRQPVVSAVANIRCRWYNRQYQQTTRDPQSTPDYSIRDGHLFKHLLHDLNFHETPATEQWKRCVPKEERQAVLQNLHDEPTAGHLGIAKTIARVARTYYWPGMFREITRYVRNCENCNAHKVSQNKPPGLLHATPINRPWQQITMDLVGPLPRSRNGHVWLFNLQDRFTKWVEMRPLRRATAEAVTKIVSSVIYRHGCPDEILSDNGTQLKSQQLSKLLGKLGIRQRFTPAYTPQCNPTERTNRTIKTMIRQYVNRDHRRWDEHLDELQFAYNTALHEATGFTPAYLNHGRELTAPPVSKTYRRDAAEAPQTVNRHLQDAYEVVRVNLARAFQRQAKYYNLRHRDWRPEIGDFVWKREHPLSNKAAGFNAKLAPKFTGPLEVRKVISPVIYDLRDRRGKWHRHTHLQDLKPADQPSENDNNAIPSDDESD